MASQTVVALANRVALLQAAWIARRERPHMRVEEDNEVSRPFRHDDFKALVTRFAPTGRVDYANFRRVRRLLEAYLSRVSRAQPEEWAIPAERLAFYLNVYNAIAIHQVLLSYPIRSIRDIPAAFCRPYPVGRELHTLHTLMHAKIRAFGDPRVHAAIVPAAISAPPLAVYTALDLDASLNAQMRALLDDRGCGLQLDEEVGVVALNRVFYWFAGDFGAPERMPSVAMLARGMVNPGIVLDDLCTYLPDGLAGILGRRRLRLKWLPYDWALNLERRP